MLSRVADTVYWMGRYSERTSGLLQMVRVNYIASQDGMSKFSWRPLLLTYGHLTPEKIDEYEKDTIKVIQHLILDRENDASVYNNILQSRENARSIQDHITKEVWQCLNDFYHNIRDEETERQLTYGDPVTALDNLIKCSLLFNGTVKNTMTRDEGYTYLHLGRFLERAIQTTDIFRIKLAELQFDLQESIESAPLRYLLYSLYGYEVFIKTYKGDFSPDNVLELVLYDTNFPHSLIYSLYQVNKYFGRLKTESLAESFDQLEFLIGRTMNNVKYSNATTNDIEALNAFLLQTRNELSSIGSGFAKYYFGNT